MIINELAKLIKEFITRLYLNDIHFYQVLIGLFIFNFIVYIICKMIKIAKNPSYRDFLRR